MKRIFLWILCLTLLLTPTADAAIVRRGLKIQGGVSEITLAKGEKKRLRVQDRVTGLPVWNGLSFFSDNTVVAVVGLHSGVLRGNQMGECNIIVMHDSGRSARIRVRVVAAKGTTYLPGLILLCLAAVFLILWITTPTLKNAFTRKG